MNVSMKDVNTLINKVDALETLVVRYHESFVSIHSSFKYLEKQTHFMKLESLSMRYKNRKTAQFPPCQRIISTPSRSVYNPYNGNLHDDIFYKLQFESCSHVIADFEM